MSDNENPNTSHQIAVAALLRKRADLLFAIGEAEKQAEAMRTDLVHLDAVIRMFRPSFDPEAAPARQREHVKSGYFAHGELTQRIYSGMRQHGTVASSELAAEAMREKGLDPDNDRATRRDFTQRFTLQLASLARKGKIGRVGQGRSLRWRLSD